MRKILLATTALAGVVLFASAASAGMEVTMGGYHDFRAGFFNHDIAANVERHNDFVNEFQLEIEAKAKANNGMEYGVVASLWNGPDYTTSVGVVRAPGETIGADFNGIRVHQAYGYVNGAWGQIRMGDEHGASDFGITPPQTYDFGGQVNGAYTQFGTRNIMWGLTPAYVDDLENNTKVTYFTPKFGVSGHKFQAGVSFQPNWYDQGVNVILTQPPGGAAGDPIATNNYKNVVELGGGYEGTWFDKFSAKAGFVVTLGDEVTGRTLGGAAIDDFTTWNVGGQIGYAGFAVGGNYVDADDFNASVTQTNDQRVWSVGASYKFDRASIAGSYLDGKGYNNSLGAAGGNNRYVDHYTAWGVGAGYSLFDGMVTSVDAVFFDQDTDDTGTGFNDNDGHVIILSNRISF